MQRASPGAVLDKWRKQGRSKVKSRPWKKFFPRLANEDVEMRRCGSVPVRGRDAPQPHHC